MQATILSDVYLGLRALKRDWQSGELRLLMLALVIAVAAVTSVGFLADRVSRALQHDSAQAIGGDLALQADEPIPAPFIDQAKSRGLTIASTVQFPSMASAGRKSQLVALKAVSNEYPLRGSLRVSDAAGMTAPATHGPKPGTVWVDPQLLVLLDAAVGDAITIGDVNLTLARVIVYEPDRGVSFVNVAPRVMLNLADLASTGLVTTGSRVTYQLLAAGADAAVNSYKGWVDANLARGQKLISLESNQPELQRALKRADQFLVLVSLLTVMIASVAIALAARRFSERHQDGIAIMRCMGARKVQIGTQLLVEFLVAALVAAAAGIVLGWAVHAGLVAMVAAWLNTSLPAPSGKPALQGLVTGLLLLLGFALPPLAALRRVPPARVLRRDTSTPLARPWSAYGLGLLAFFALIVWISGDVRFSIVISASFLLAFTVFSLMAYGLLSLLAASRNQLGKYPALHFALTGMARRRALTITQLCAMAMGLTIILLLAITRTDLLQGWQATVPAHAPNTFLINIQPDQRDAVQARLEQAGIAASSLSPMVRGRLVAINKKVVSAQAYEEDRAKRLVEREFNLSYTAELPASNTITQGQWLDPAKHETSLETGLAQTLGINLNDMLTFDIAGVQVEVRVSSLREVKWDSFQANFFALLSPAALRDAPTTYITSFYLPTSQSSLAQDLLKAFPNVTIFDVGAILGQVQHILDEVIQAVQLLFLFTVLAGILVLAAAMFSTREERMHEVAILRALGASRRQLLAALRIELGLLGALAGVLAAFAAVVIAQILAHQVFDFDMVWPWWPWLAGLMAGMLASLVGGSLALSGVLKTPPLVLLRSVA